LVDAMADKLTQVEHMKYFQEEVTPTLEDLMMVLVVEQPDNPVPAMIRWLVERTKAPTPAAMEQKQLSTLVSSLQADITALEAKLEAARAAAGPPPPEPIVLDTEVAEMAKAAAAVSDAIAEKTPAAGLDAVEAVADAAVDPLVGLPTPKDIAEAAVKAEVDLLAASPEPTIISEPAPSDPVSAVEESLEEGDKEAPEAEEAVAAAAVDAVADAGAPAMDHAEAKPEATTEFQPLPELGAPAEAAPESDPEQLRQQAKATLLEATSSGALDAALMNLRKESSDSKADEIRMTAKQTLLEATNDGRLEATLSQIRASEPISETEQIRQQARESLEQAVASGSLDAALAKIKQEPEEKPAETAVDEPVDQGPMTWSGTPLTPGMSTPGIPVDQLQQQIVSGLKDEIGRSVSSAVGGAVREAFSELQDEMKRRTEQTAKMNEQMAELTSAVKSLQEKAK